MRRYLIGFIAGCLNFIIPKDKNRILVCDSAARKDNSWAVTLALTRSLKKYKITYYTRELSIVKGICGIRVTSSLVEAMFCFFRAYTVFYSYAPLFLFLRPCRGQRVVNLWHGSPLKDISFLASLGGKYSYKNSFTYVLSASAFFDPIMQKTFGCEKEHILRLGAPRNDWLFSQKNTSKLVVWLPTFRKSGMLKREDSAADFPLLNEQNAILLDQLLGLLQLKMIIKLHPAQTEIAFLQQKYKNIELLGSQDLKLELYELLAQADVLLTDYSSVYFDFLLTQRPIGFVIDDIESYRDKRGFTIDNPLSVMPGEKIMKFEELTAFLTDVAQGVDLYKGERERINLLVNEFRDNKNCDRLLAFLFPDDAYK